MFGILSDLAKVAVGVVKLPIDVVADVATLGGSLTEEDKPYTAQGLEQIMRNLSNAVKPD
jgi:hypothetical protein